MTDAREDRQRDGRQRDGHRKGAAGGTARLADVMANARHEFEMITGREVEAISAVHRHDGGWTLCLEVVELRRVPDSTSILGTYETTVDGDGSVIEYERTSRYHRNQASEADSL